MRKRKDPRTPNKGYTVKLKTRNDSIKFGTNILKVKVPSHLRRRIRVQRMPFLNDAFGGRGLTPSTVTLFTGEPGAGKTTMSLLMADRMTRSGQVVIFNTGEESLHQIKMTAERLKLKSGFQAGQETNVPQLLENVEKVRKANPKKDIVLIIDSLQTLDDGYYPNGHTNSKTAVRALEMLTNYAKDTFITVIVIGQVNKGGEMAGANTLKHMVDVKLHLGMVTNIKNPYLGARFLRTDKNRFGPSGSVFYLGLNRTGFKEIARESGV